MNVELMPFTTPNYVIGKSSPRQKQDGISEGLKWHISDIDANDLSSLCDQFRRDVFEKAGKSDPRMK